MNKVKILAIAVTGIQLLCACRENRTSQSDSSPAPGANLRAKIFAANYPLQYFAQRIGKANVEVSFPAPKDVDPAFWQPTDEQISAIQNADLIILNGATFSKWAEKVSLPEAKIVDTAQQFKDRFIVIKNAVTHSHGKQGMHSHDGISFTTWIDFQQAIQQASAINDAFKKLRPQQANQFDQNFAALKRDLEELDSRMSTVG